MLIIISTTISTILIASNTNIASADHYSPITTMAYWPTEWIDWIIISIDPSSIALNTIITIITIIEAYPITIAMVRPIVAFIRITSFAINTVIEYPIITAIEYPINHIAIAIPMVSSMVWLQSQSHKHWLAIISIYELPLWIDTCLSHL